MLCQQLNHYSKALCLTHYIFSYCTEWVRHNFFNCDVINELTQPTALTRPWHLTNRLRFESVVMLLQKLLLPCTNCTIICVQCSDVWWGSQGLDLARARFFWVVFLFFFFFLLFLLVFSKFFKHLTNNLYAYDHLLLDLFSLLGYIQDSLIK